MKILKAKVDWCEQYDNAPSLKVLVDKLDFNHFVYEQKGDLYFAEHGGLVSYYYYNKPDRGFGGREFELKMKDGSTKILKGPWSSRAEVMNAAGFPACREVTITDEKKVWKDGYTFYGSNVLLTLWKDAIDRFCKDAHYVEVEPGKFEIARKGMTFAQSQAFKRAKRGLKIIHDLQTQPRSPWQTQQSWEQSLQGWVREYNKLVTENNLTKFKLKIFTPAGA